MDWRGVRQSIRTLLGNQQGLDRQFVWGFRAFHGLPSHRRRQDVASTPGLAEEYTFSLTCDASQFGDGRMPRPRIDKITMSDDGTQYRILDVELDSLGASVRLDLGSVTQ